MLHREADEEGNIDWRQISGLNEHGFYHTSIDDNEALRIARETKEYETACLQHEIGFLKAVLTHFQTNRLRHIQRTYDAQMRRFKKGDEIDISVHHNGKFEQMRLRYVDL